MIVRAGVDDRHMVSALGINIQFVFAGAFFVGAFLAGLGGVLGGTMISVDKGNDTQYLLIALIVVIIGGMGSLGGAALGALALGLVDSFGDVYLPEGYTNYSVLLIFGMLVLVLAVRPLGLSEGRRDAGARDQVGPRALPGLDPGVRPPDLQRLLPQRCDHEGAMDGIAAVSLIFLAGYVGMVSLGQVALYGIAGFTSRTSWWRTAAPRSV